VVRMALLPSEYLAETVGADPLVTESFEALRIFAEASRLKGAARAAAESDGRLRKRKHASGGELVVVGGLGIGSDLKSAEMYDPSAGPWRALPDMSVARYGCAAVAVHRRERVCDGRIRWRLSLEERGDVRPIGGVAVHRWERTCGWWRIRCRNPTCEHGVR
jgi:hypothetical protein